MFSKKNVAAGRYNRICEAVGVHKSEEAADRRLLNN
jgi:hypothetical protein